MDRQKPIDEGDKDSSLLPPAVLFPFGFDSSVRSSHDFAVTLIREGSDPPLPTSIPLRLSRLRDRVFRQANHSLTGLSRSRRLFGPALPEWKGVPSMARVSDFYSVNETKKPPANRVYHNNDTCPPGRDIPQNERRTGQNGYRLCEDCQRRNR